MKTASTINALIYLFDSSQITLDEFKDQAMVIVRKFNSNISYDDLKARVKNIMLRLVSR